MKPPARKYWMTALVTACIHFGLVVILSISVALQIVTMTDQSYQRKGQQLYRLDRAVAILTFPVMQILAPAQPYGSPPTPPPGWAKYLIPLPSLFWGSVIALMRVAVARLLGSGRGDRTKASIASLRE
jgi:hypothetical protein